MIRREFMKLLGLLPLAPLARLAPAKPAVASEAAKAAALGVGYGMNPARFKQHWVSIEIPEFAVPAVEQFVERQRKRQDMFVTELFRDGAR